MWFRDGEERGKEEGRKNATRRHQSSILQSEDEEKMHREEGKINKLWVQILLVLVYFFAHFNLVSI